MTLNLVYVNGKLISRLHIPMETKKTQSSRPRAVPRPKQIVFNGDPYMSIKKKINCSVKTSDA